MKICSYLEVQGLVDQSGIGRATRNVIQALRARGIEVTTDPSGDFELLHLQWIGPKSLSYARKARRKGRPVVLSVYSLPEQIRGAFNCSSLVTPTYRQYLRVFFRLVDRLIAPSPMAARSLSRLANTQSIKVVSSGVDLHRFCFSQQRRDAFRRTYSLDRPTVLAVGQVIPLKGVETFLEVAREATELCFLWAGPQPARSLFFSHRFERRIRHRPANVHFAGYLADVESAYCGCDLFFHPSHGESLGLAILEAAAVGLPLLVRRLEAYEGWLHEGEHCLMGEAPVEFKVAIEALLSESPPSLATGQLARQHALPRVGEALVAVYREVLG